MGVSSIVKTLAVCVSLVSAQSISQINGGKFNSPYAGKAVTKVEGLVTAIASNGLYMRSTTPDNTASTSESIFVYSSTIIKSYSVGDIIQLDGNVTDYRSSSDYLYTIEIEGPTGINLVSSGNTVTPVVLGKYTSGLIGNRQTSPPTHNYTYLDGGDVFAVPNDQYNVSTVNPALKTTLYGLDFWQSLSGEYVTVPSAVSMGVPSRYGEIWVIGAWPIQNQNARGGLTAVPFNANPEAILVSKPLDGTSNPDGVKLGDTLGDITGVITYQYGQYALLPNTKVTVQSNKSPASAPATSLTYGGSCTTLTIGSYNVDNFMPNDTSHIKAISSQIVNLLKSPPLIFLQEIQDNSGATDNGVVNANTTLGNLVAAIKAAGGPTYAYVDVDPIDGTTGGQPGGNIRNAYIWLPSILKLNGVNPGSATQDEMVLSSGKLKYNPGEIMPNNAAWDFSRRPLVAQWVFTSNSANPFYTVNSHWTAKLDSTSLFGNERPPINNYVNQRDLQANVTADFIKTIFAAVPAAKVIMAGDINEGGFVKPVTDFEVRSTMLNLDDAAGISYPERYGYIFAQNCQRLVHVFISKAIASASTKPQSETVHANTWSSYPNRISDHDPTVMKLDVCA